MERLEKLEQAIQQEQEESATRDWMTVQGEGEGSEMVLEEQPVQRPCGMAVSGVWTSGQPEQEEAG